MRVTIIGAGMAGLATAYRLIGSGHQVGIYDRDDAPGGLARSFPIDSQNLEIYYHFICKADQHLVDLAEELGVGKDIQWAHTKMDYFYQGKRYSFSDPADIFTFTPLTFFQRLRFGLSIAYIQRLRNWKALDAYTAESWLKRISGEAAYDIIWRPLIEKKFQSHASSLSAAWIWGRTHRHATSRTSRWGEEVMGFFRNGTQVLIDALVSRLSEAGFGLHMRTSLTALEATQGGGYVLRFSDGTTRETDAVVSTIAGSVFVDLVKGFPDNFRKEWKKFEYLSVLCLLVQTRRPLSTKFWTNVNDPEIPYLGSIEYSNLNPRGGTLHYLTYLPQYLLASDPAFKKSDAELREEAVRCLKKMYADFQEEDLLNCWVFKSSHAQPVCTVNHLQHMMPHETPLSRVFMGDTTHIFPEDRGVSNAIAVGETLARLVNHSGPVKGEVS